jgi:hypothetical protein
MKKSKSVNLKKLNNELEEVKEIIHSNCLQGYNDEKVNKKYHKLLSEINQTKLSKF